MSKERKRINLSVTPDTFAKLEKYAKTNNYKNECELVCSVVNVMLDRLETADKRQYDIPDDDGQYIDNMFVDMANNQRQPDGTGNPTMYHRNNREQ